MSELYYPKDLIDKYRDVLVGHGDWYESVYEHFKEMMSVIGIRVDKVYFSGFWSQGDGACFEGRVEDWGKYLLHLGYDNLILHQAAEDSWSFSWTHSSGRYYHEQCVTYNDEIWRPANPFDEEKAPLQYDTWANTLGVFDLLQLTEEMKENLRGHMRSLYRTLEKEYDHLTSDETVSAWMQDNYIELTELEI